MRKPDHTRQTLSGETVETFELGHYEAMVIAVALQGSGNVDLSAVFGAPYCRYTVVRTSDD
jgi:hypothetical protein